MDGHDIQRRAVTGAGSWLAPGGSLLMETSSGQSKETLRIFQEQGLRSKVAFSPELEATVVIGTKVTKPDQRV
jgi:release factor glutamine methyltransferase